MLRWVKIQLLGWVNLQVLLTTGSGAFIETEENAIHALLVDEAHRLNEKSGLYGNLGSNQVKEIIRSTPCSVFFIDESQRVTLSDIGTVAEIEQHAKDAGAFVSKYTLASQFRCNGSDGYIAWLDDVLGIRETANSHFDHTSYDFRVYGSATELHNVIREYNGSQNKSRIVAGYCWDWKSKRDPAKMDIILDSGLYQRQWNLTQDGSLWIISPNSVEEIGCIHTCQGLEVDYIGVIIGPDLIVRDGKIQANYKARSLVDRRKSLKGIEKIYKSDPKLAQSLAAKIIKNTYRTLMSRGMKGCFIFSEDDETREYFRNRSTPLAGSARAKRELDIFS